jgi:hypothetical protein
MNPVAKIEIIITHEGKLHVSAPLHDKQLCFTMLGEAIKGVAQAQDSPGILLANGAFPNLRQLPGERPKAA